MQKSKLIVLFIFIGVIYAYCAPFFGGSFTTINTFDKNKFTTINFFSFYIDNKFNDNVRFFSRVTLGEEYYASYSGGNDLTNLTLFPSIDLLFIEFKRSSSNVNGFLKSVTSTGENFDAFNFKAGRIFLKEGTGTVVNMKGDGLDTYFSVGNFRFRAYGITNSFDYTPIFDFNSGGNTPTFTNWDRKRLPSLYLRNIENNVDGFISDPEKQEYNFFIDPNLSDDYTSFEAARLNKMRYGASLYGRIFTGFSFELHEIAYQNFGLYLTANVDLIPRDYIVTYPSLLSQKDNTSGGRYTSFYFNFNVNGRIIKNLYYNFDGIYETGFNSTIFDDGTKVYYSDRLINTFYISHKIFYLIDSFINPRIELGFVYAHGDEDAVYTNDTVQNKAGQDNGFRSICRGSIGYAADIQTTNIVAINLSGSIKPLNSLKKGTFSRFYIKNDIIFILRPVIKGATFYKEKEEYTESNSKSSSYDKVYLGTEADMDIIYKVFSDFNIELQGGIFIPNSLIYDGSSSVFWKVGLGVSVSF